jgi:hypothetical protein
MSQGDAFPEFLAKKAYEISYAVFRVSGGLDKNSGLRNVLEASAASFLEAGAKEDLFSAEKGIKVLGYLLRLGGDTGVLYAGHVNLIINELANLESAIAENKFNFRAALQSEIQSAINPATHPAIHTDPAINPAINPATHPAIHADPAINPAIHADLANYADSEIHPETEDYIAGGQESEVIIGSEPGEYVKMRQEAILQFILQSGNCKFRDIFQGLQDKLQDVGERTVRYDLQDLIEQGKIEKFGTGGSNTFYRVKIEAEGVKT